MIFFGSARPTYQADEFAYTQDPLAGDYTQEYSAIAVGNATRMKADGASCVLNANSNAGGYLHARREVGLSANMGIRVHTLNLTWRQVNASESAALLGWDFRYTDKDNYAKLLLFSPNITTLIFFFRSWTGAVNTDGAANYTVGMVAGSTTTYQIIIVDDKVAGNIKLYVDGVLRITESKAAIVANHAAATKVGIWNYAATACPYGAQNKINSWRVA